MTNRCGSWVVLLVLGPLAGCAAGDTAGARLANEHGPSHQVASVCADGTTVPGIDISYYQGTIDWEAVAADGIAFAFIRVSDGLGHEDSQFADNWSGAKEAGVRRGAYQFFRSDEDAIAQADFLLDAISDLEDGDLPPVIDVESTDGQSAATIIAKVKAWLDHVEAATGRTPIIYTGRYFWQDNVGSSDFAGYPLWNAHYGVNCPDLPDPWSDWTFWQHSTSGEVDGISGGVDSNWFNGDLAELTAFAGGT